MQLSHLHMIPCSPPHRQTKYRRPHSTGRYGCDTLPAILMLSYSACSVHGQHECLPERALLQGFGHNSPTDSFHKEQSAWKNSTCSGNPEIFNLGLALRRTVSSVENEPCCPWQKPAWICSICKLSKQTNQPTNKQKLWTTCFLPSLPSPKENAQDHAVFLTDNGDIYWGMNSKGTAT